MNLDPIYGINSLDKSLPNTIAIGNNNYSFAPWYGGPDYTFISHGVLFKYGECCEQSNNLGTICSQKYVSLIPKTNLSYCKYHYRNGLKKFKTSEKNKIIQAKLDAKEEKINALKEINKERSIKGLLPLKRLPTKKKSDTNKKSENIVENSNNNIEQYNPDEDSGCNCILKSGSNKGKKCGIKKIENNGLCKRHYKINISNNDDKL
jgi:hypothetical protein